MNISNQVQIIYVPYWVRLVVFLLMFSSISICGYLFFRALADGDKPDWIAAGAYLLGVVFPILLLVIVVAGASFGERSIVKRTEKMLVKTIPYHLQFLPEEKRTFVDFRRHKKSPKTKSGELAKIQVFHSLGRCYADYIIDTPFDGATLRLELRVEMNVKRANINVWFSLDKLNALIAKEGHGGDVRAFLRDKFRHSLDIEELQAAGNTTTPAESSSTIAYSFNRAFLTRTVDDVEYLIVVATTNLPEDTVWNPSERVFFAQDLMFMVRSFMQERPEIFETREHQNS
ncbi:hypothetical protein OEG84_02235 [Hoeflea sp. G2-23]|uniref:DUF3137 domain-containing protein n=1 Tax=Hoeflea algicola TaxID=2983763 RepID=A0ABT3Z4C0_9HYPH|nr:hypothetical protein [Hoeflea algicola]MCY0146566.1 hypothetical protein [Hoeflea algicola]